MKKNISYREKLLELVRIYKISEVQNYFKRKKNLTNSQIEHILKKNKVPIPKEFNVGFFQKNFSKPLSKAGKEVTNIYDDTSKGFNRIISKTGKGATGIYDETTSGAAKFLINIWRGAGVAGLNFLNIIPKVISAILNFVSDTFTRVFSSMYESKFEERKIKKIIASFGYAIAILTIGIVGFSLIENYKFNEREIVVEKKEKLVKSEKKITQQKKEAKIVEKKEKKKELEKIPEKKNQKTEKSKDPSQVKELVLPNLNLKTETVLSLFEDVEYDLRDVRYQKRVKPIYFTQFPKDLDEIKDVQLKKETFIKIVLPLVVAENDKILSDRSKLKQITSRKMTTDKEKLWLRQKLREYKVKNSDMEELKKRMDIIPVSIALAQAAKESGWGTSRFALEGNAIFGQWTWTGQGIEPLNKNKNEGHKILRFPILRASVKAYKNNLNTHKGYSSFREKRYSFRKRNKSLKGVNLTDTLDKYAQTGKEYTKILEQIITQNNLTDFETVQLTNSVVKKELNL
ncbi:MAG: hypothetical protein CL687_01520 [Candidatus Pelagibacter sp.]|nr:hypothetical protein [Candidatus Pelagibacter sp.]OUW24418.1 MAG: hypothetical protein CBD34_00795 [Rickettsiales bacterium TMED174]